MNAVAMRARDWFERIRADVLECARLEEDVLDMNSKTWPRGQTFEAHGRGSGAKDGSAAILRVVQAEEELERRQTALNATIDEALVVLYGLDGRGGLARLKDSATADCICGYYLMGMKWREVANEIARHDSEDARHWCMMRAYRGFECMDRIGMDALGHG